MKKIIVFCCLVLFSLAVAASGFRYARAQRLQKEISEKVLRFHVLANSDSETDQALKLKVRDAVGNYLGECLSDADSLSVCEEAVGAHLAKITRLAQNVVAEEGYDYPVTASLEETEFPVKSYGTYTFPAGSYEALRIVIGAGEGQNWWCVMYPNLCFADSMYRIDDEEAGEQLRNVLSADEYEEILAQGDYKIRLKYLSFFNCCLEKLTE